MKRVSSMTLVALALLSGCAGTRMPKLAKCVGPSRYANPYGTVLPSLPISGQPAAQMAAPAQPVAGPASPAPSNAPITTPPVGPPTPAKSSALLPPYPSC